MVEVVDHGDIYRLTASIQIGFVNELGSAAIQSEKHAVIGSKKLVRDMNRRSSRSRQAVFRTTNRSLLPDSWVVKRRT